MVIGERPYSDHLITAPHNVGGYSEVLGPIILPEDILHGSSIAEMHYVLYREGVSGRQTAGQGSSGDNVVSATIGAIVRNDPFLIYCRPAGNHQRLVYQGTLVKTHITVVKLGRRVYGIYSARLRQFIR